MYVVFLTCFLFFSLLCFCWGLGGFVWGVSGSLGVGEVEVMGRVQRGLLTDDGG